jgi:predicted negative regulator of RcsB-dependent stress response
MNKDHIKQNVETLAKENGETPLEVITQLQAGAAIVKDEDLLDALCELKWDYIK